MSFSYAAVYQAKAVCLTPLRTGGADGDAEQVLRRKDGTAFVQGTSLAGAMLDWLKGQPERSHADDLFGSQEQAGHLTVSDVLFDCEANQLTRPRLRIDPVSATGDGSGKFDVAHMGTGSKLSFTLVWQGNTEDRQELDIVEKLLGAVNAGDICLGAQKSNGFGRLSLFVRRRLFNLKNAADRRAWLADDWMGEVILLPAAENSGRVKFAVTGRIGSILIKDAPAAKVEGDEGRRSYIPNLSENGKAVLPGSSVKGAVRARAAYIAKMLGLDKGKIEQYFGRPAKDGDNGLPGLVRFEDVVLSGHKRKISRIRIDRFTGGVQRQGLFTEEPISSAVALTITAPEEPVLCALLVYALRDLGLGLYHLGSGWAIGRGKVEVEEIHAATPDGRQAALRFDSQGNITQEDSEGLLKGWLNKLEEEVRHG